VPDDSFGSGHGIRPTPLQLEVLRTLEPIEPRWTLVGGGALSLVHLGHRTTRDLDLFWRGIAELGDLRSEVEAFLARAGLRSERLRSGISFQRLVVAVGDPSACPGIDIDERVVLDLVAEPGPPLERPERVILDGVPVQVDSERAIVAEKLCALLSRSELRDLVDVRALLARGHSLADAARLAPMRDGGFSAPTLAWVLRTLDVSALASRSGEPWTVEQVSELARFRDELVDQLVGLSR
jgi:hypothetical protein